MNSKIKVIAVAAMCATMLTGCTKSCMVSHNVSKEANNFNVTRKITVINVRDDNVLYELTGNFSMENSDENELKGFYLSQRLDNLHSAGRERGRR